MRRYIFIAFTALTLAASSSVMAQIQGRSPNSLWEWRYEKGDALFKAGKYAEAYEEFRKVEYLRNDVGTTDRMEFDYYYTMSAYHAEKINAEGMLIDFSNNYPESSNVNEVNFALGNIYSKRGEYSNAVNSYLAVNANKLLSSEQDEYNFKIGYAYFRCGDYDKTMEYMLQVHFKSVYYIHAQYVLGHIEYAKGDYAKAKHYFEVLVDSDAYADILPFYIIQIEFRDGNYSYVLQNGVEVLRKSGDDKAVDMSRIIGESWFYTSSWQNAVKMMGEYEKRGGEMDRNANYIVGFSHYMMKDYEQAEKYLSKVPGSDDKLSQNASYHLGDVYLRLGDKQRAMQSFSIASVGGYDDAISEDALFNYGKMQYESGGGYFNEAINILNRYLESYPSSPRVAQVREYLAAAYYNSRDYDAAYQALSQMYNPDNNVKAALQKITFFKAVELYKEGKYDEASAFIDKSLSYRINPKFTALAGYWQGESMYRKGDFKGAAEKFEEYIILSPKSEKENLMARYNAAYSYFNLKEWDKAKELFSYFIDNHKEQDSFRADTYNRLGDIDYNNRNYWRAIDKYDEAAKINTDEQYYSAFQKAVMFGMVDRLNRKIESLEDIIMRNEGSYVQSAAYELGKTYVAQQKYSEAAKALEKFVADYPSSPRASSAYLDLGLVYQNLNDNNRALSYYKMVVEREKNSPQSRNAMNGIRNIYVEENNVNEYFAYATQVGVETDNATVQRDSLEFVAAQRVYLNSNDQVKKQNALAMYIKSYPNGIFIPNAIYYLGENALARSNKEDAYKYFRKLSEMYNNPFTSEALAKVASLGMEYKEFDVAADAYAKLGKSAATTKEADEALAGQLRAIRMKGDNEEIARVASDILTRASSDYLVRDAKYAKATALNELDRRDEAMVLYEELSVDVSSMAGAESAFRVIEAVYAKGDKVETEKMIFAFADKKPYGEYWLARAFIILGDIYSEADDTFQARATYQSIADGYSNKTDGILDIVEERIKNLK